MNMANQSGNRPSRPLNSSQIARVIFAAAESMGIRDRRLVERLTTQVIERLEKTQTEYLPTLPGMEDLVAKRPRRQQRLPTDAEIEAMVKEILDAEKPVLKEAKAEMETKPEVKPQEATTSGTNLTETALHVLGKRYLKKDKQGQVIESPEEMFRRVARAIASAELIYDPKANARAMEVEEEFYRLMANLEFLPNSPTLMNAGRELGQLSACFVLPVGDSMESIFDAVKYTALIHKSGGGTGFSFSRLRPEKDRVGSTGGIASGPVSFMRVFDTATDVIKQGGTRRGANMAILRVDHPDIMNFITAKEDMTVLTNFNLSVAVTEQFMEALKAGTDYNLINPYTKETEAKNAEEVFDKIVDMAWRTGDPGVVFIDRINDDNPTPHLGDIESTNPCGEQPLLPYESCNLASINLARMMRNTNGTAEIDDSRLAQTVRTAVRFLDNVIDVNRFPLSQIEEKTKLTRKIGLGIMGFADMLVMMGIPYDSDKALVVAEDVMATIQEEASKASKELAEERGAFPAFKGSVYDIPDGSLVRNATCTTIAPTGTLSMIAGCSSGIEPLFALSYTKTVLDGTPFIEVNPYFEETARKEGFYSEELMQKLADGAHLNDIDGVPEETKRLFVTAHEISPEWHVKMQAAFQKSTHNAVSKTINFPQEATREDVARAYRLAYEEGLKGITIYRDRSRDAQVLTTGNKEKKAEESVTRTPRRRAKVTTGVTERVNTGCGALYISVNSDEYGICEVFSNLGKAGGCASAQLEAICRLISLALRSGVDVASVVKQLRGIRCPSIAWEQGKSILSCADAIASVLEKHISSDDKPKLEDYGLAKNLAGQCPECSNMLIYQEGCYICPACGYTKC